MIKAISALALSACIAAAAQAQTVPPLDRAAMADDIATLASDDFGGRGPGTADEAKTTDYIIARFRAAGLQPGNAGQWLQDVPTVRITPRAMTPLTIEADSGTTGAKIAFTPGADFVAGSYREVDHVALDRLPLVFVGFGIVAPELGWNDYAGIDMKGKIAVILVNDPDYAAPDETGPFRGRRMTWYGRWPYKYEEAARQGAAGALIVHDTFPAAYGWNVVQSSWGSGGSFIATPTRGMDQTQVNGWVQKTTAQALFKAAGLDFDALALAARQKGFRPVAIPARASLSFDNTVDHALSHNVIGVLPGATRPRDVVLYTAHWDHLGHCTPDARGDAICNGAVDNASGVGALIALAAMNHRAGPAARTQAFLAVTLEESGLLGSAWYAAHPVWPLAQTVGGVNIDGVSPGGLARDVVVTGGDKSELTAILRKVEAQMGLAESPEPHPERGGYYRSDHFSLAKVGVPMFRVGRGTDLVTGGKAAGEAAREDYTAHRYHQPSDEFSRDWDFSGMAQEVELYYRLGRTLADGSDWPNWHAGDEFRAIRDASRASVTGPNGH